MYRQYIRIPLQYFFPVAPSVRPVHLRMAAGAGGVTFDAVFWNTELRELRVCDTCEVDVVPVPEALGKLPERMIWFPVFRTALSEGWADTDKRVLWVNVPSITESFEE